MIDKWRATLFERHGKRAESEFVRKLFALLKVIAEVIDKSLNGVLSHGTPRIESRRSLTVLDLSKNRRMPCHDVSTPASA